MNRRWKYIIGLVIIGSAFFYLIWTSFKETFQFALTPTEFISKQVELNDIAVKISGTIEEGSILVNGLDHNFNIADEAGSLSVHYKGMVPNTFRAGADVVVNGKYIDNIFEAKEVITKCASKYEAK